MGNRATVVFTNGQEFSPAVYLHWNGGPESVYSFLRELDRRQVRSGDDYEAARFVQIVGEFFSQDNSSSGHGLSLGIVNGPASSAVEDLNEIGTDHGNNGLYLVQRATGAYREGESFKMRRFTEESVDGVYTFREWTEEMVEAERKEADAAEHRHEFAKFYKDLGIYRASQKTDRVSP